jgi:hypothetical protein
LLNALNDHFAQVIKNLPEQVRAIVDVADILRGGAEPGLFLQA